eukprot:gene8979-10532_t
MFVGYPISHTPHLLVSTNPKMNSYLVQSTRQSSHGVDHHLQVDLLMSSTGADNTVKVWQRLPVVEGQTFPLWTAVQSIEFKPRMMECCSLALLPGTDAPVLALGGCESNIHVFVQDTPESLFRKVVSLRGHQDWVRCLSFATDTDTQTLLLASSSQDFKIRLWRFIQAPIVSAAEAEAVDATLAALAALTTKGHVFNVGATKVTASLESVLAAHEDWVSSVSWQPATLVKGVPHQSMCLISASMDKTMIVWRPDASGVWNDELRVGDMGGNILGLYGGVFSPSGAQILSHGYNGAFHLWQQETSIGGWTPQIVASGHFGPVQDLMWSPDSNYFISCSSDRTLRIFAEWKRDDVSSWHEIARPQIHGYDLECFSFIHTKSHTVVSGAEEKILRVFIAPQNFIDTLSNIARVEYKHDGMQRPLAANQPTLGLSNKAYFSGEENVDSPGALAMSAPEDNEALGEGGFEDATPFNPEVLESPPFEEHLLQSSLWPEIQKLYGHGNEIIAVACSYDGTYIATTCRASSADQATVRIWTVSNWKEVANLKGHTLTVVQLAFSHDGRYLLGVSRDRMWTLWRRTDDPQEPFVKVISVAKSHGRIVWGCSWSHDDRFFVTGSRDKVVKIWSESADKGWTLSTTLPTFSSGVTSVEFSPAQPNDKNM